MKLCLAYISRPRPTVGTHLSDLAGAPHKGRRWNQISYCLLLALIFLSQPSIAREKIDLKQVKSSPDFKVTLSGSGFGKPCNQCQVIIEYKPTLRFAAKIIRWNNTHITAQVPDINNSLNVKLSVKRPKAQSNTLNHTIKRKLVPSRDLLRPVSPGSNKGLQVYEFSHKVNIGDKGEDRIDVSSSLPACGANTSVFDHARIVYTSRRFGEAQITSLPESGCTRCKALKIRWYHEPTGRVEYQVHVYKRIVSGICEARRQR